MNKILIAAGAVLLSATPALAHHPLGGMPMETFAHGLLSGIGHPILGFDHLFFVLLVGVAALFTTRKYMSPAAYIAAMLIGCLAMSQGVGLPAKEIVIGLSLLVLGGIVLSGRALAFAPALLVFAGFGLFHGSAFGDTLAGQEGGIGGAVLIGYLIGLGVVQYAIAVGAGWVAEKVWNVSHATDTSARLAGAVVAGIGLFLTLENAEGIVFSAMGWG
ncbi:MAG: HupE/UreJ family protein [Alphaproteobacteria bacterium]